ncbi:tripartite tricarboxylate transporter permease [Cocleimonas sp. KMM 6892]|jgi:TctA family transporter|uniref:tripartite tricarboxylate transporter permease n=1 Tax=unclassified Cocleimonas TaxID=2639732 RepID=UPI002DBE7E01|nr:MULTISPECIES: tripartite tricarboxylate transporter permease [unclassified Cocleimonas]MEB8432712.1 tripartite tricarboxylate transporter permease [Cocleimonas sp. KMM 6892]MEC4715571.1 tripartite tricarboxylate transporter permease [Cocleimonas sp. KMM 6895]MEC4744811.1 tripartite tricarboxylate transporter permease [Cocleimonas sp. KMM 6896]
MDAFIGGLSLIFDPYVLMVMVGAAAFGLVVGSIPGLTATMATALLIPVTFFMDPVPAIAAIVTTVATAIFAGDIPGALLRIPGTPASAAYCDEAFAMTRKGKAQLALGVGLTTSIIGGLIGAVVLMMATSALAEFAFKFSSYEYFWLACLGLSSAVVVSSGSTLKGFVSLLIGLFIATIGIDLISGHPRFTFGSTEMLSGVSFIPAMIGMFAISEVLRFVAAKNNSRPKVPVQSLTNLFKGVGGVLFKYKFNVFRGSSIGAVTGVLPGAGADIAAWVSYGVSKRTSKEKEKYGTGHVEGLVDAGSANNAGLAGAWVPALVFGIPGDSVTAIAIGVLYMKGMNPGPMIFQENPQLLNAVFIAFFVANLLLLPLGYLAIRLSSQLLKIPSRMLMPAILIFCLVGSFAITNSVFGVVIMLAMGVLAYIMEENGFPIAPTILGIVLGAMLEEMFLSSMIKADGELLAFFSRPISATLGVLTILIWLIPLIKMLRKKFAKPQLQ